MRIFWVTVLLLFSSLVHSAEIRGYAVLTSDYVFRGVTYSDGDPAVQLGADVQLESGWFFGAWGSTMDVDNGPERHRDRQANFYAGYLHDIDETWTVGGHFVLYTFPGQTGNVDYDYEEWSLVVNYGNQVWFEYSWSPSLYNTDYASHNYDLLYERPIAGDWTFGLGGGYYDVSELSGTGYGYWHAGFSRVFGQFDVDLRYHDTNRAVRIVSTPERADSRIAVSLRFQF